MVNRAEAQFARTLTLQNEEYFRDRFLSPLERSLLSGSLKGRHPLLGVSIDPHACLSQSGRNQEGVSFMMPQQVPSFRQVIDCVSRGARLSLGFPEG